MMRPLALVAIFGAMLSALTTGPSTAQPQQLAPIASPQPLAEPTPKPVVATKGRRWLKADARVCLEFPTDMQIIACSEKYR